MALREYENIYDGSIRFFTDMSEDAIRNKIVRLVRKKGDTFNA